MARLRVDPGCGRRAKMATQCTKKLLADDGRFDFGGVDGRTSRKDPVLQSSPARERPQGHDGRRKRRLFRARFGSFWILCKNYGNSARQNRTSTEAARINRACMFLRDHFDWWGSKAGAPLSLRALRARRSGIRPGTPILKVKNKRQETSKVSSGFD